MRPVLKIRPSTGWCSIDFARLWHYRDLLGALAARDVKLRYRQTLLGVAWVILQPLLGAGIFAFVFGRIAGLKVQGSSYFLFTFASLLAWNAFSSTLLKASGSLVQNASLVAKVFFPRLLLPFSTVVSSLLDFLIGFVMFAILLLVEGNRPGLQFLTFPLWLALLLALALGAGTLTSALAVKYRDVNHIVPVLLQLLLYASPVGYSLDAVPASVRPLLEWNPVAVGLEGFRWALLGTGTLSGFKILYAVVACVALGVVSLAWFSRVEKEFADVI